MLIPLIVIGVLFLITWIVIGVSAPAPAVEPGHNSHDHCPNGIVDPFHTCNVTRLQGQLDATRGELGSIRHQLRYLEDKLRYTHPISPSPAELLKELTREDTPPKEIKIKDATYKLKG